MENLLIIVSAKIVKLVEQIESVNNEKTLLTKPSDTTLAGQIIAGYEASKKLLTAKAKELTEVLTENIKLLTVNEACELATSICVSPEGADDSMRQRLQRRRNTLKNLINKNFEDYEVVSNKIDNRAVLAANYIGTIHFRKAATMINMLNELSSLGYEMPELDKEVLAYEIEKKAEEKAVSISKGFVQVDGVKSAQQTLKELTEQAILNAQKETSNTGNTVKEQTEQDEQENVA